MVKTVGYFIFALFYNISRLFPVDESRVLCIMTHDDGEDGNVSLVVRELKKRNMGYSFSCITKSETEAVKSFKDMGKLMAFFFVRPYQMARAGIILMDNVFLPMAYIRLRSNVKVVQLWHGTGTIKRFGQDANTGRLKALEKRANRSITHLIVNSEQTARIYAQAFGIDASRIYPMGLPKTDDILNRIRRLEINKKNMEKDAVYGRYRIPGDKKLILYAPTFRDENLGSDITIRQVKELAELLPRDYILGLRLHPFVAGMAKKLEMDNICDLSGEKSLSELIMASDILITDYSSIIFEYCLTQKPMIFFAYDLDEFEKHGRGFYRDYTAYVPGPVARTAKEVADIINRGEYSNELIRAFNAINFPVLDGEATMRIIDLIIS
ncbi:MAG: glycosyltransferase [Clostridiales bacterium]|jgi:CDP-ribitol ribitolphosphotransferase|nr:glycosyltransferase [Clostridiales bacterium]